MIINKIAIAIIAIGMKKRLLNSMGRVIRISKVFSSSDSTTLPNHVCIKLVLSM